MGATTFAPGANPSTLLGVACPGRLLVVCQARTLDPPTRFELPYTNQVKPVQLVWHIPPAITAQPIPQPPQTPEDLSYGSARGLTSQIKACQNWRQLQRIYAANTAVLNHIHVSALLTRLGQLANASQQALASGDPVEAPVQQLSAADERQAGVASTSAADLPSGTQQAPQQRSHGSQHTSTLASTPPSYPLEHSLVLMSSGGPAASNGPTPRSNNEAEHSLQHGHNERAFAPTSTTLQLLGTHSSQPLSRTKVGPTGRPHGPQLNYGHHPMAPTFTSIPLPTTLPDFARQLMDAVSPQLPSYQGRQLANTLWAVSKLACRPSIAWLSAMVTECAAKRDTFDPQQLSNTMYALAVLGHTPSPIWLEPFLGLAHQHMPHFKPQELANLIYACGKMGVQPGKELALQLQAAARQRAPYFNNQELCIVLFGLAHMGIRPSSKWLSSYLSALLPRLQQSPTLQPGHDLPLPRQLSSIILSMGTIGYQPPLQALAVMLRAAAEQLPDFGPRQLSNLLLGLAYMGYRPPMRWLGQVFRRVEQSLSDFSPQHLANLLWSISRLGYQPPRSCLTAILFHTTCKLQEFKPQELSSLLLSTCRLQCQLGAEWLDLYLSTSYSHMDAMSPQELAVTLYAMGRMNHKPPKLWMDKWLMSTRVRMQLASRKSLCLMIWSLATLGFRPGVAWKDSFLAASELVLASFVKSGDLHTMIWSLAVLELTPGERWMQLFVGCVRAQFDSFNTQGLSKVIWGLARLGYQPGSEWMEEFMQRVHSSKETSTAESAAVPAAALAANGASCSTDSNRAESAGILLPGHTDPALGSSSQHDAADVHGSSGTDGGSSTSSTQHLQAERQFAQPAVVDFSHIILQGLTMWAAGRLNYQLPAAASESRSFVSSAI